MERSSKSRTRIIPAPQKRPRTETMASLKRRIRELEKQKKELIAEKPITVYFNKSIDHLATLNEIGMKLTSFKSKNEVSEFVVQKVAKKLEVNRVSLMLLDRNNNELVIQAAVGLDPSIAKSSRVKLGRDISGWVAKNAEPILVENIRKDSRFKPHADRDEKYATDSFISTPMILSVPLQLEGSVVGVMNANDKKNGRPFNEDDLIFLSTVAAQAAIALENSRLFEQLKASEQEQQNLQQQLYQAQKLEALAELLTGITHELNNRLAPVLIYAQFLQLLHKDKKSQKYLKIIEESVLDSKSIIESMVTFAKPRLPKWEKADINHIVTDALEIIKYKLMKQNIRISTQLGKDLPKPKVDPEQIKLVLVNILNNAHSAMEKDGGELYLRTYCSDDKIQIEIEDTGIGIAKENLARIFDPFFTSREVGQGMGLGLSVCYGIVKAHHGKIEVQSEETVGSVFTVVLPLQNVNGRKTSSNKKSKNKTSNVNKKGILLVDDDTLILETMSEILKIENAWDVAIARNGKEAIRLLKKREFDVIVSDLRMPGMDGFVLYDWIMENYPEYKNKIIFTTGDIHDSKTSDFLVKNKVMYLAKPFNIHEFRTLLNKYQETAA